MKLTKKEKEIEEKLKNGWYCHEEGLDIKFLLSKLKKQKEKYPSGKKLLEHEK